MTSTTLTGSIGLTLYDATSMLYRESDKQSPLLSLCNPRPILSRTPVYLDTQLLFDVLTQIGGSEDLLFAIAEIMAAIHVAFGLRPR